MENYKEKIKICFVIDRLNLGGAENLTVELINYLDKKLFEVTVIYLMKINPEYNYLNTIDKKVKIQFFDIENYKFSQRVFSLKKILKNFDIIHSSLENSNFYFSFVKFLSLSKVKYISTIHGVDGMFINDVLLKKSLENTNRKYKFLFKYFQSFLFKFYDLFIAVCMDTKEFLTNVRHIKENKIKVVYHGLDIEKISSRGDIIEISNLKKKFSLGKDDFVIGYIGRITYAKGLEYLIDEFAQLKTNYSNMKLLLVGDGELKILLEKKVEEYNLQNDVIFAGFSNKVENYYKLFDVFILPSFSESTNLTILEAMNYEILVVSSNAGGLKEIITHNENGLLFNVGNFEEMRNILEKVYLRQYNSTVLISNAKKTVISKFDLKRNLLNVQNLILDL